MIKAILSLSLIQLIASLVLPWWIIVVVSLLFAYLWRFKSLSRAIIICLASGLLVYSLMSIYTDIGAERSAASLLGDILGGLPSWTSYLITGLIGGITSAFGGMTGYMARSATTNVQ